MHMTLSGHQVEITTALREFVEEKIQKLEHHAPQITNIHIVLKVEKLNHIAEATVTLAKQQLNALATAEHMYTAIDDLIHKLDKQLLTLKSKRLRHRDDHH